MSAEHWERAAIYALAAPGGDEGAAQGEAVGR
jgi:hypothetical protein